MRRGNLSAAANKNEAAAIIEWKCRHPIYQVRSSCRAVGANGRRRRMEVMHIKKKGWKMRRRNHHAHPLPIIFSSLSRHHAQERMCAYRIFVRASSIKAGLSSPLLFLRGGTYGEAEAGTNAMKGEPRREEGGRQMSPHLPLPSLTQGSSRRERRGNGGGIN